MLIVDQEFHAMVLRARLTAGATSLYDELVGFGRRR
jgi:hypothetical protein